MKALLYRSADEYIYIYIYVYDTTSVSLIIRIMSSTSYLLIILKQSHNLFSCISTASIDCACKAKRLTLVAFTVCNTSVCEPVSLSGAADAV